MEIKKEMVMREVGGDYILVPTGNSVFKFNGLFTLTEGAAFIWTHLPEAKNDEDIVRYMIDEYDVDEETATKDVKAFLDELRELEII